MSVHYARRPLRVKKVQRLRRDSSFGNLTAYEAMLLSREARAGFLQNRQRIGEYSIVIYDPAS